MELNRLLKRLKPQLIKEDWEQGKKDPLVLLAQGLGSGCFQPMQGTWGTLGGLAVYFIALIFAPYDMWLGFVIISCFLGVPLCTYAEKHLGDKDPHSVVWDEWCGIWISLLLIPPNPLLILIAFVLFRFLDIKKPWIIGMMETRFSKGAGIMLDDILAGIFTAIAVFWIDYLLL